MQWLEYIDCFVGKRRCANKEKPTKEIPLTAGISAKFILPAQKNKNAKLGEIIFDRRYFPNWRDAAQFWSNYDVRAISYAQSETKRFSECLYISGKTSVGYVVICRRNVPAIGTIQEQAKKIVSHKTLNGNKEKNMRAPEWYR